MHSGDVLFQRKKFKFPLLFFNSNVPKTTCSLNWRKVVLASSWGHHWDPYGMNIDDVGEKLVQTFSHHGMFIV